jgi:hypothetical protein
MAFTINTHLAHGWIAKKGLSDRFQDIGEGACMFFDDKGNAGNNIGIKPGPGHHQKSMIVGETDSNGSGLPKGEGLGNFVWLKRLPDFARYNIGGPQWNNGQRYLNALQAIDNLVDGAIASSHRYDIIGKWINLTGQGFCVAPFKSFADCKSTTRPGKGIEYLMKKPSSFASGCRIENNKNATV